jgi:hypothetical protein
VLCSVGRARMPMRRLLIDHMSHAFPPTQHKHKCIPTNYADKYLRLDEYMTIESVCKFPKLMISIFYPM